MRRKIGRRISAILLAASVLAGSKNMPIWAEMQPDSVGTEENITEENAVGEETAEDVIDEENENFSEEMEEEEENPVITEVPEAGFEYEAADPEAFDFASFDVEEENEFTDDVQQEDLLLASAAETPEFVQEGISVCTGANGFVPVQMGSSIYKSKYIRLGWNADSQVIPWNRAGEDVLFGERIWSGGHGTYFLPRNDAAKGKFGYRVTKVGYNMEADKMLDLLITCTDYKNYSFDIRKKRIDDIYPYFGMIDSWEDIWILFQGLLPDMELKVDIVESGTDLPVKGDYRFRWLDIDGFQRFGFALQNGSIDGKYAVDTSVLNVVDKQVFGRQYEVITAPREAIDGESPEYTVVYEIGQSSGIMISILNAYRDDQTHGYASRIKRHYQAALSGVIEESAGLNWDSKAYGPVEYPTLEKSVGNDINEMEKSNVLPSCTSEYYYTLQTYVPEEHPAYYYRRFKLHDVLPAGVDYNGYAAVTIPGQGDVTGQFHIQTQDDDLVFEADPEVLAQMSFYGKAYEFKIGVRMDPTELETVYSGDTYEYRVKNSAELLCEHKNSQSATSKSNEVETIYEGKIHRLEEADLEKYVGKAEGEAHWEKEMLLPDKNGEYAYKLSVNVPKNEYGAYWSSFIIKDTLPQGAGFSQTQVEIYDEEQNAVQEKFTADFQNKTVEIRARKEELSKIDFYGKCYNVILRVHMIPSELTPHYDGLNASYHTENVFTAEMRHAIDERNTVYTSEPAKVDAIVKRADPQKPLKWIRDENGDSVQKEFDVRTLTAVYAVEQLFPEYETEWEINGFNMEDALEDCLEFQQLTVYVNDQKKAELKKNGSEENGWRLSLAGQTVRLSAEEAVLAECYGKKISAEITVNLKKGCDLSHYYTENRNEEILESHIPNMASAEFSWKEGTPEKVKKETETVWLILKEQAPKGRIVIKKFSEDEKVLSGAGYQIRALEDIVSLAGKVLIKAGTVVDTLETEENGQAVSKELYPGDYKVQEIKPPKGYAIHTEKKKVSIQYQEDLIAGTEEECVFYDKKSLVFLEKVSEADENGVEKKIENAEFRVWKKADETSAKVYMTNEHGQIRLEGLEPGNYCYQEISVPDGYVLDANVYEFEVNESGMVEGEYGHIIKVENQFIKAEFIKQDKASGKPVEGAEMLLKDQSGAIVDRWISEKTPHRINRIAKGIYTLSELKAPDGYQKSADVICAVKETGSTQIFVMQDTKLAVLKITKSILSEEIVWEHGNPVFTFCISGKDIEGKEHTYYEMVEFSGEKNVQSKTLRQTFEIKVPAGIYRVEELQTSRYKLKEIRNVIHGTADAQSVQFDLSEEQEGAAEFLNEKVTDRYLTDTAFARNVIIEKK